MSGRIAEFWSKDGAWHITEPYVPTAEDREMFPASYPPGDDGPFYIWSSERYYTEAEALEAIAEAEGTGRARAGTIRSPIWRGGGKTFAAKNQDHSQKLNKKMYRAALRSILSELVRQERLVLVDDFDMDAPRTKELAGKLSGLGVDKGLIVARDPSDAMYLSARNLPNVDICDVSMVDPVSLVGYNKVVMTVSAVKQIEEALA